MQAEMNFFELENYNNQIVLFDNDHLRLNVDIIGTGTIKGIEDFASDTRINKDPASDTRIKKDPEEKEFVCDICLRKFATLKSISMHLRLHTGKYFCSSCKKGFRRAENFKHHKCNQIFSHKCPKCERIFYQKKYLGKHISLYHNKKYACSLCHRNLYSPAELRNHYCKKAPKEKRRVLKCPTCSKTFISDRGLKNHQKNHSNIPNYSIEYICLECGKKFSSKDIYHRHVSMIHNKSRAYNCPICDKVFHRSDVLKMHLLNIHRLGLRQTELFKCQTCKKEFKAKKYLDEHIKLSHNNSQKYICKQCESSFKYSRNLSRHVKLVHNNVSKWLKSEYMHECPICKNKMKLKRSLQTHIKQKHPECYKNFCTELNARKDEMKHHRYKCPVCRYKVKLKSTLQRHMSKKHPKDFKSPCTQLNDTVHIVDKEKKNTKLMDNDDFDNYMDLQKPIKNMDFNLDTYDNLLSSSETIDVKESTDQISILFAKSLKAAPAASDSGTTIITDRMTNRELGLSMPDLLEIKQEPKAASDSGTTVITDRITNSKLGLSIPDLLEIKQEPKAAPVASDSRTTIITDQMTSSELGLSIPDLLEIKQEPKTAPTASNSGTTIITDPFTNSELGLLIPDLLEIKQEPKAALAASDSGTTIITDQMTNSELGLSMPDLLEIKQEPKATPAASDSGTTIITDQITNRALGLSMLDLLEIKQEPKDAPAASDSVTTIITDQISNRELGLSMPDLLEIKQELKLGHQQPQQIFNPGHIILTPTGAVLPTAGNLHTTMQLSNEQSVQVRSAQPQVFQFPMQQTMTIPIQVPISSGNGQTIYQMIHFPFQLGTTAAVPTIIQVQPQLILQMASNL